MAGGLDDAERTLAAELISPLIVANRSYSHGADAAGAERRPRTAIPNVVVDYAQNETIVRRGERITPDCPRGDRASSA